MFVSSFGFKVGHLSIACLLVILLVFLPSTGQLLQRRNVQFSQQKISFRSFQLTCHTTAWPKIQTEHTYLPSLISSIDYEMYKIQCNNEYPVRKPMSEHKLNLLFREIYNDSFSIRFRPPHQDTCR